MRKTLRWCAGGLAGLVLVAVALYLLRWPLLEGRIRREVAQKASELLSADVSIERLGGSLLSGLDAEGVVLRPRPGSPLRAGSVRTLAVRYGFLGKGPLRIDAAGVDLTLAPRPGAAPKVHDSIREILPILRSIRFDGRVDLRDARVELSDGRRFEISSGSLEGGSAEAEFRTQDFGLVRATRVPGAGGAFVLSAAATEGAVRSVRMEMGAPTGPVRPLKIDGRYQEQSVAWEGTLTDDAEGRPARASGRLVIPQGRAETEIDLVAGRARVDVDGTVPLREPLRADIEVQGRAEGPIEGPLEEWSFSEVVARTRNVMVDSLRIDYAEATCSKGSLASLPVHAGLSAGPDHAVVDGVVRWKGALELELQGRAQAEVLAPYLRFLSAPPPLGLASPRVEGRMTWSAGAFTFDGELDTGPGSYDGRTWDSLHASGSVSKDGVTAREFRVSGCLLAPVVTGKGSLRGERLEVELEAGADRVTLKGRRAASGDLEGELTIDGPCRWLEAAGAPLPPWASPLHLRATGSKKGGEIRSALVLSGGEGWSAAPDIAALEADGTWTVAVGRGELKLPAGRVLRHEPFVLEARAGRVALPKLALALTEPPARARLSTTIDWDERGTRIDLEAEELEAWDLRLDALHASLTIAPEGGAATVDARWGREGAPSFRITGSLGPSSDLNVLLRIPDLRDPLVRKLSGGPALEGSVTGDLHLGGSIDRPEIAGTLSIQGLATADWKPLSLVVPVRTEEGGALRFWCDEATPYGSLRIDGTMGLPGDDSKARVDLAATLQVDDLQPFLERVDPGVRPWIPLGKATISGHLRGPIGSPLGWLEASFESDGYTPPAPLGRASELRLAVRLDEAGVQVANVEGRLGGGAFHGKGLWEIWKEDRPLSVHVVGDELLVVDDSLARIRITPDVTLHHTATRGLWLTGSVEVPLVLYHRELGSQELGRDAKRGAVPLEALAPRLRLIPLPAGGFRMPGIPALDKLGLDLTFKTTDEVLIENSVIGLKLGAEGRLRGTAALPALSGIIRSKPRHGELRIGPGAFVRVESGQLILPAEPGKEASVRFEGRIGSGQDQITILVSGPPENASLTLLSDPPKDQRELLAVLGQKAALGTLTSQITPTAFDDWPSATRREGLLSRFTPTVIPGESPGQRHNPWELPSVGTARGTVVRTEYLLNKYFSVIAESDREVEVSGDLKFRIRF